jgi:D-3-phosphoglycerate dehydrogenase
MQRHALLINTARGAIVDEGALVTALHRGQIGGAALDVYETEPVPPDSPLLRLPNVLLTPHVAAHTEETLRRMAILTAEEVLTVLGGKRRRWLANPEILASLFGEPVPQEHNQFKQGGGDNA